MGLQTERLVGNFEVQIVGKATLDERGRILVPAEERERLGLSPGAEIELLEQGGALVIRRSLPAPLSVFSAKRRWGREAFLDAGEATFGD